MEWNAQHTCFTKRSFTHVMKSERGFTERMRVEKGRIISVLQGIEQLVPTSMASVSMGSSVRMSNEKNETNQRCSRCRITCTRLWKFFSAYGAIFAYYGSALGGLGASLAVTVVNE